MTVTTPHSQKLARAAGVLFIITFLTSIPAKLLYDSVLGNPDFIVGAGGNARVLVGALLELLLIVANVGSALVLFPALKRQSEHLALGYVAARLAESGFIAVGILSVLAIVTLHQNPAGADAGTLVAVGHSLSAIHDWTFLLGPGFVVGIGNGMTLGYLMYRSGLVPRRMAMIGLVGGPLLCLSTVGVLFGAFDAGSLPRSIMLVPEIAWEASLGIYLTVKGFRGASSARSSAGSVPAVPTVPAVAAS